MEGFFLKIFTSALWAKSSTAETLSTQSYRKETYYYLCESFSPSVPLPHPGHHVEVVELYISKTKKKYTSGLLLTHMAFTLENLFNRRDAKYAELPQRNILLSPRILSDLCASATSWPSRGCCLTLNF